MPVKDRSIVDQRREIVLLALAAGTNRRQLCRQVGISPTTLAAWLRRYTDDPDHGLEDRSRRPQGSPRQTPAEMEAQILQAHAAHPTWGGRKLAAWLRQQGIAGVPSHVTVTAVLQRHGLPLAHPASPPATQRFEREHPHDLWQLDFMGHKPYARGRVYPFSILDDHSRFGLGLFACAHTRGPLVMAHLTTCFRTYGLPEEILCDNGPPWGSPNGAPLTVLAVWLLRLGIRVTHGRSYHPQTQGKIERWHRTINLEVFGQRTFATLDEIQRGFDAFRQDYNLDRPHFALGDDPPIRHFQLSRRAFPATLPELDYDDDHLVVTVRKQGLIRFGGRDWLVSNALRGQRVGIRPTATDGCFQVRFGTYLVRTIDLNERQ